MLKTSKVSLYSPSEETVQDRVYTEVLLIQ